MSRSAAGTTPGSIPRFRDWDITAYLPDIRVPVLHAAGRATIRTAPTRRPRPREAAGDARSRRC